MGHCSPKAEFFKKSRNQPVKWIQHKLYKGSNHLQLIGLVDICEDINRASPIIRYFFMEHFLEGIALLRHWYINPNDFVQKFFIQFSHMEIP